MFSFFNFAFLSILLVAICDGAPTVRIDALEKRDGIPMIARSTSFPEVRDAQGQGLQKRTFGGGGGGGGLAAMLGGGGGGAPGAPPAAGGGGGGGH